MIGKSKTKDAEAPSLRLDMRALVMMQLKEKIDMSFLKTTKSTITKVVFTILGFVAVILLCFAFFYVAQLLRLFSLAGYIPVTVLAIAFSVMLAVSVLSCTGGLVKMLYFSKDNRMLLTLPVPSSWLYVSKLLVFYLYEVKRSFSFMIPMFVAFGIITHCAFYYYPWIVIIFLFVSALPVLLGALLSIPAMYGYQFLKQYRLLQLVVYVGVIGGIVYGIVELINILPLELNLVTEWIKVSNSIQGVLRSFEVHFAPLYDLTTMIAGKSINLHHTIWTPSTLPTFGILVAVLLALFFLGYLLAKPLFFHMSSQPFEYRKRNITKTYRNHKMPAWLSAFKKEMLLSLRTPDEMYNNVVELVGLPLIILLLNRIYSAMNTRARGDHLSFAFNILIMLLFMLSANVGISSVYSREGRAAYFNKVPPTKYYSVLLSKLYMRIIVSGITAAVASVVFLKNRSMVAPSSAVYLAIGLFMYAVAHIFWSAEVDIMNPQTEQYGAMGDGHNNPNETKSTIIAFLLSIGVAAFSLFLFMENEPVCWKKFCYIGVALCLIRVYLYLQKVKLYYKEK